MNFIKSVAKYVLDNQSFRNLPYIAVEGIEEGFVSPSLIILAGLSERESPFVIDAHFRNMLHELKLDLATKNQAALYLAKILIREILDNSIDAYEGSSILFREIFDLTDFRDKDTYYVYDSIGLAKAYSYYSTIGDLLQAAESWDTLKTNADLIEGAKVQIKAELINWLQENEN